MPTRNIVPRANGEGSIGTSAKHWGNGYFDNLSLAGEDVAGTLSNMDLALAESTGCGIVSGCTTSIAGLTVTVASGIVHLADGTRKELSATNITLDDADSTNPRIDLVYIDSTGAVAKITGTAAASPSAPNVPTGGISVCNVTIAAGAPTGTITDKRGMLSRWYNTGIVNVKDFGAKGDGITDDTQALQTAFAANAYTYYFPRGTYKVTQTITISKSIRIIGDNAILNFTSGYLLLQGSLEDAISVSSNVQEGDNEIVLTTNSINAGDYILLIDDTDYSFSKHRAYYKKSDIFRIKENTGTKLVLEEQTTAFYNASHDLKVRRINMITVDIHGINIEATTNDSSYALACRYCVNSHIKNCSTKFGAYGSLYLDMCLNFNVDETYSYQTGGISGYQYGISISESKNVTVRNSVTHGGRHAIAIGTDGRGICRNIVIDGCELSKDDLDVALYCADIHGAASNVTYINNRISGGVCIAGEDANYINNIIVSPDSYYPAVSLVEAVGGSFRVINNKIIMSKGNTSAKAIGFHSTSFLRDITYDYTFEVKDNEIAFNGQQQYCCEFGTYSSASDVKPSFEVSNNTLTNNYTTLKYLVYWAGEVATGGLSVAPRRITFRDFSQRELATTFELLKIGTGSLSGCKIEFPLESYRVPVSATAGTSIATASQALKYIPTTLKIGNLVPNYAAPLSSSIRSVGVIGGMYPFSLVNYYSTGAGVSVFVTFGDTSKTFPTDYTYYVDVFVGGPVYVN